MFGWGKKKSEEFLVDNHPLFDASSQRESVFLTPAQLKNRQDNQQIFDICPFIERYLTAHPTTPFSSSTLLGVYTKAYIHFESLLASDMASGITGFLTIPQQRQHILSQITDDVMTAGIAQLYDVYYAEMQLRHDRARQQELINAIYDSSATAPTSLDQVGNFVNAHPFLTGFIGSALVDKFSTK